MQNQYLHEVAVTAIVIKEGRYLITRRAMTKRRFPGKWTVPGGKMETNDYLALPKDTEFYWYNVLERTLKREVKEEVGLDIKNIDYVTSLATVHDDGAPSLVISCMADYESGEVKLQEGETDDFAWVTLEEVKDYDLLDGIYEEFLMADKMRKGMRSEWDRNIKC
ncbi:MAG: NUDIX domain-containing protein [Candidatus Colwellbacteria bacterium]|jgi:8-oxo-dGTP pyrophosphatase MutT (NUDIX family)|nr:NUDIX domain-containing protein [Candidatus Colwellbacteria bacterium]MCK9497749.1 NUDIX domain-containing protein [Candidatus Colwellbacteria bacterium]MDD3752604.1 NUDIX domain-containing protein [Candidatus Colwellbacteria bacterium]MDD4818831.1 NUDIX domain-containing protein [Candidatus Colwellbacteria bacterium]